MGKPTLEELGGDFCRDTRDWFDAWRDSPRTDGWDAPQWQYMKDTATVHDMIYGQGMIELMVELQKRLEYLGLTFSASAPDSAPKSANGKLLRLVVGDRARKAEMARAANGA